MYKNMKNIKKNIKSREELLHRKKCSNHSDNSDSDSESDSDYQNDSSSEEEPTVYERRTPNKKIIYKKSKESYKKKPIPSKSEQVEEDDEDAYETVNEDTDEDDYVNPKTKGNKINILLTLDDDYNEDEDDDLYEEDTNSETEDEDVSVSSSDEDEDEAKEAEAEAEAEPLPREKVTLKKRNIVTPLSSETNEVLTHIKNLLIKHPNDNYLQKWAKTCETEYEKYNKKRQRKLEKQKAKNMRIFRKISKDKNPLNDTIYYKELDVEEQKRYIKQLREINKSHRVMEPYRMTLIKSDIPLEFKSTAMQKINALKYLEPGTEEYHKLKTWTDSFMRIPFGKYEELPITINDGMDKCQEFMENAQKTLDDAVYGLNDAKMQIMQLLGQLIMNPSAIGSAIAIHGPPGTGKTSLVKEGVSKILKRPFSFIALGGATDSSSLEGHSYTYIGSTWGKIVQILMDSKCMNPVIYFDELDKISDTPRGEEITGILTHLTDTTQNSIFHDKYFSELSFDLSKCIFIFSYNDETKINTVLKDRMYHIKTNGYSTKEKIIIANNYLIPKIQEQVRFCDRDIIIPEKTLTYIIEKFCKSNALYEGNMKEQGVRGLKRCIEIIYTKLNLFRLMKRGSKLLNENFQLHVEFPFTLTNDVVDKLIKQSNHAFNSDALALMYN
jgi:ATP-dependent Lon protease